MFNEEILNLMTGSEMLLVLEDDTNLYVPVDGEMVSRRQHLCLLALKQIHPEAQWISCRHWVVAECDNGLYVITKEGKTTLITPEGRVITEDDLSKPITGVSP